MSVTDTVNNGQILWQTSKLSSCEQALLITPCYDSILIEQEKDAIRINYESLKELINILKNCKKP